MKIYLVFVTVLVLIIFLSGCISKSSTLPQTGIEIKDVQYQEKKLLLTLNTNQSFETVKIDALGTDNAVLCTKYATLAEGINQLEMTDCVVQKNVKISVSTQYGLASKNFKLNIPVPTVKIESAKYELGDLVVVLDANMDISNLRFEVASGGNVLCTKYFDIENGEKQKTFSDCGSEEKITISVTPPKGAMVTKDFSLEAPPLTLSKGTRYDYTMITCGAANTCSNSYIAIYVTEENSKEWSGIASIKNAAMDAYLLRYKISKADLGLRITPPLSSSEVVRQNVEYKEISKLNITGEAVNTLFPFILSAYEGMGVLNLNEFIQKKEANLVNPVSLQATGTLKIEGTEIKDGFPSYKMDVVGLETDDSSIKNLGTLYVSTTKPYLLTNYYLSAYEGNGSISFKGSTRKDFSFGDYVGYKIET